MRDFVTHAFAQTDIRELDWQGSGLAERGLDAKTGQVLVEVDPRYFRPTEVDLLIGDPSKAKVRLGWSHETTQGATCAPKWSPRIRSPYQGERRRNTE